jgi:vacuolar-type H+-ATPase subunit H
MTATSPSELLTAGAVIDLIESGTYARDIVATIARGFLPLPQAELIAVLGYLGGSEDAELAELARASLHEIPSRVIGEYAANESVPPERLLRLMRGTTDAFVLEVLIRNRQLPDEGVVELALHADAHVQEVIVINHARILRAPEILDALMENPELTADTRRRVHEAREEFFVKKARQAEEEEPEVIDIPLEAIADLLEQAAAQDQTEPPGPPVTLTEAEKKDERASAVWARLSFMTIAERVQLAFRGDRMLRLLLVRDRNRLICSAVMRNPRMGEQEAESIAGMRNVDGEVMRLIGARRDWMGKYKILMTLCRNPKAPVGVVLPFINRLTLRDLKGLKDDKGVQQVVRETAKKLYLQRIKKSGG